MCIRRNQTTIHTPWSNSKVPLIKAVGDGGFPFSINSLVTEPLCSYYSLLTDFFGVAF